jgi:hypothetical protein
MSGARTITDRHASVRRLAKEEACDLGHCMGIYQHRYEGEQHIVYSRCCFCDKRIEIVSEGLPSGVSRASGGALSLACLPRIGAEQ